jgi:hypothetical protein
MRFPADQARGLKAFPPYNWMSEAEGRCHFLPAALAAIMSIKR